jgi:hypothetical protein
MSDYICYLLIEFGNSPIQLHAKFEVMQPPLGFHRFDYAPGKTVIFEKIERTQEREDYIRCKPRRPPSTLNFSAIYRVRSSYM